MCACACVCVCICDAGVQCTGRGSGFKAKLKRSGFKRPGDVREAGLEARGKECESTPLLAPPTNKQRQTARFYGNNEDLKSMTHPVRD